MVTGSGEGNGSGPNAPPSRRRRRVPRLAVVLGLTWLVVPLVLFLLARGTLLAGHPAHLVALAVAGLVGVVLLVLARGHDDDHPTHRRRWGIVLGRLAGVLVSAVVLGGLVWLQPFPATAAAASAMAGEPDVRVVDVPSGIVLSPRDQTPTRALVFQPGARVDPRAYVPILTEVSRAGYLVVVVKQPFEIALLATGAPGNVMARHPEVTRWAVGGHSLGGVAAADYAASDPARVNGLVLWASYPVGSLADRADLAVASVSGSRDGFTTPDDVAASRALLPASTAFTVVDGAVHSSFGDYGTQPGDGTPTVDHETAQRQIVAATVALLARM
ncbi:alpha/beta hydrolase [Intrasporangium flavum]|uniref:alpha/beta hydrolase n=1 Tax=Intrasporangium flavum TaxID=1428657 RepID=UPI001A977F26|nr:alpha/beta hydrolase [Intrasporangium flavum]